MPLLAAFAGRLRVPVIAAPMFLISGPDLVVSCCRNGVVGSFPALNQRTTAGFADWLDEIAGRLDGKGGTAPFGVNLVVHRSNPRLDADLAVVIERKVPLVITSLGLNRNLIKAAQGYGGLVFHDVTTLDFAAKAAEAGVDGLTPSRPVPVAMPGRSTPSRCWPISAASSMARSCSAGR
jgi:nitronate monooxygenase